MRWALPLLLLSAPVAAEDRLAVLEFFGRPAGTYCQAAAPAMLTLQTEMEGRALLLEYDYDQFRTGRMDRWWAAYSGGGSVALPVVMVGSGYRISSAPTNYLETYRAMLQAELARPPAAAVQAWARSIGDALRVYVRAENLSATPLSPANSAALWVLVWEDGRIGLTETWVRATASKPLTVTLDPGGTATAVVDVPAFSANDRTRIRSLALLEHRLAGGKYDMLQAAVSTTAGLVASPGQVTLGAAQPAVEVSLTGPHVLEWTATSDVPWLELTQASGSLPAHATVRLVGGQPPVGAPTGHVRFDATGDGMAFTAELTVATEGRAFRVRRRLYQDPNR